MEKKIKEVCNIPDEILSLLQKDIAEIKVALLGNEYNPAGGLLYRTSHLEQCLENLKIEQDSLKRKYDKIIWSVSAGAAVIATLISFISQFWDKLSLAIK